MTAYTPRMVTVAEDRGRRVPRLNHLQIWLKLAVGLGVLAALTVSVVLISDLTSAGAGQRMRSTETLHVPAAFASQQARSDMLSMANDLQSYLVFGQPAQRSGYNGSLTNFSADLAALDSLAANLDADDRGRLAQVDSAFVRWKTQSDRLLALRADQPPGLAASDASRTVLDQFSTDLAPLTDQMTALLDQVAAGQRQAVQTQLGQGRVELSTGLWAALAAGLAAILFSLGMFFFLYQGIDRPISRLTRVAEQVREGDLAAQAAIESHDEIGRLTESFNRMTRHLRRTLFQTSRERKRADDLLNVVIPLGLQLSGENDWGRLLESIVVEAQTFCRAASGVLYLRNDKGQLQPIVLRDDASGLALGGSSDQPIPYEPIPLDDPMYSLAVRAAWFGTTVNVPDAVQVNAVKYVSPAFVEDPYEHNTSFLAIPLKPSQSQVMGVLQLTGARDPEADQVVPFDSHLQQMMESFSLLAAGALAAYLREQGLKAQIQQLRIEIDEVKRQQQVKDIVESDFFPMLQAKAREARGRTGRGEQSKPSDVPDGTVQNPTTDDASLTE